MEENTARKLRSRHEKIISAADRLFQLVLAYALLAIVLIVVWQIVTRNLSIKNTWTEEASRWLFVWTCLVGTSYFTLKNDQIVVDLVREIPFLRAGAEKCEILFKIVMLAFYVLIMAGGVLYVINYGGKTSGGLRLPFRVLYYSCPVSYALTAVFAVYDLWYTVAMKIALRREGRE